MESFNNSDFFSALLNDDKKSDFINFLKDKGVPHAEKAADRMKDIFRLAKSSERSCCLVVEILLLLKEFPRYENALKNLQRLLETERFHADCLSQIIKDKKYVKTLFSILNYSNFFSELIIANPSMLCRIFDEGVFAKDKFEMDYLRELTDEGKTCSTARELKSFLASYRNKELLRIGARDYLGEIPYPQICRELSDLATAIVRRVADYFYTELTNFFGIPSFEDSQKGVQICRYVILGMGKLGGGELNFSSDIDIIFAYEEEGQTVPSPSLPGKVKKKKGGDSEGKIQREISNHKFFTDLFERIIDFIMQPSSEGKLFRIDVRLRPEGSSGPLVRSLESYNNYFFMHARPWERLVYLKAKPIAGDFNFGEIFLKSAEAFVFDNPDVASLSKEIAHLKQRIDNEIVKSDKKHKEVKRGIGGIREMEFVVYLLQILHGRKNHELRSKNFCSSLLSLNRLGILPDEEYQTLQDGYVFLRKIEHHLQMCDERQTHLLPESDEELRDIAARFGFPQKGKKMPEDFFLEKYKDTTFKTHNLFKKYFNIEDDSSQDFGMDYSLLLDEKSDAAECFKILRQFRFKEPASERCFKRLAFGTREYYISADGQKFFERILPTLLAYSSQTPFPDQAVRNFDNFLESAKGITSYYSVIAENPGILKLLLRIFGTSNYLSRILFAHPEYFDELVDPGMIETLNYPTDDLNRFFKKISLGTDVDREMNQLRKRKRLEFLKIGTRDVLALFTAPELSRQMTALAEGCVKSALELFRLNLNITHGMPFIAGLEKRPCRFCIAGMGGLGAGELTYFSDLDIICFYEGDGETNGAERISNYSFFTNLSEELMKRFSQITPEDFLYKLDARLRPEGANAPLLISSARLIEYYENAAQFWEILAFFRFKPIAGDIEFGKEVREKIISSIIKKYSESPPLDDVKSMREKIERSIKLPSYSIADLKRGIGGLFDIEFITNVLRIKYGKKFPEILIQNTSDALGVMNKHGILSDDDYKYLSEGLQFYRNLQSKIRLLFESPSNYIPQTERLESIEAAFAFTPKQKTDILHTYKNYSKAIRDIFTRLVKQK